MSNDVEQSQNIDLKLFPFETFQFSKGFIFDNDLQPWNINEKYFPFETF